MSGPGPIDLRSDTVTRPSPAMRRAMAEAEGGEAGLDGGPPAGRLRQRLAGLVGQEAASFFAPGRRANQAGSPLLPRPGTELVLEADARLEHQLGPGAGEQGDPGLV